MKKISLAFLLLFCMTTFAQQGINYKALIKDGSGAIVANDLIQVQFTILDAAVTMYTETHTPTTDGNGIIILNIGEGTPISGDFSTLDWSSNNHFLNVRINTGLGLQDMGTTAFKTVPYALSAKSVQNISGTANTVPKFIDGVAVGDSQIFDNGNYVGIGTDTPNQTLHLHRDSGINYFKMTDANSIGNGFRIGLNGTGNVYMIQDTPNKGILFGTNASASSVLDNNGDWGLGTTTPSTELDVNGQIRMRTGATEGYLPVSDVDGKMTWTDPNSLNIDKSFIADTDGNTKIQVEESTNEDKIRFDIGGAERMVLDNSGNLGINNNLPSTTLHVTGSGSEIARFEGTGSKWISLYEGSTRKGILWSVGDDIVLRSDGATGNIRFQTGGNNDRMSIDENGVGIFTATPDYTFEIEHFSGVPGATTGNGLTIKNKFGDVDNHWSMYNWSSGNLSLYKAGVIKGTFSAVDGAYTNASDRRLKTQIEKIEENILEKINLLNPSRYYFKDHVKGSKEYGLIAQEVQEIFPELTPIIESKEEGAQMDLLGVNYTEFVPILIKGMQEQQEIIEVLNAKNELLETQNASMLQRISQIESRLDN